MTISSAPTPVRSRAWSRTRRGRGPSRSPASPFPGWAPRRANALAHVVEQLPGSLQPGGGAEHRVEDDAEPELLVFGLVRRCLRTAPDGEHRRRDLLAGALHLLARLDRVEPDQIGAALFH